MHIDNKGKDTLIIGKGPIQGLDEEHTLTTFTRGALYPFILQNQEKDCVKSTLYQK